MGSLKRKEQEDIVPYLSVFYDDLGHLEKYVKTKKKEKLVPDTVCVCVPLCVREMQPERDCKRERESWVWVSLRNGHKQIGNIC